MTEKEIQKLDENKNENTKIYCLKILYFIFHIVLYFLEHRK